MKKSQRNQPTTGPNAVYIGARKRQDVQQKTRKRRNPLRESRYVDYLDTKFLDRFINDQGKILPRRITGATAYQQRLIAQAIKYARHLALVSFVEYDVQ
jgi:small subunit ribosomal protein S18